MLWTADSIDITADQICWTADGYNGCDVDDGITGGGRTYNYPIPGTRREQRKKELEAKTALKKTEVLLEKAEDRKEVLEAKISADATKAQIAKLERSLSLLMDKIEGYETRIQILNEDEEMALFIKALLTNNIL